MRLFLALICFVLLAGCHNDDRYYDSSFSTSYTHVDRIAFDPLPSPVVPIAVFHLDQAQTWDNGWPYDSITSLVVTNTTGEILSFNFVVSGPGWRFESAVIELWPGQSESFYGVSYDFDALASFYLTVQSPVVYLPTADG